jgi:cyclic-di-GMP phosphodiesterase TipF (flagellum assembly factor)
MPLMAHILLVSACGAFGIVSAAILRRLVGLDLDVSLIGGLALAMIAFQAYWALVRHRDTRANETRLQEMEIEQRRLLRRLEVSEVRAAELEDALEHELAERRVTLVSEMRGLEDMISRLGESFDSQLEKAKNSAGPRQAPLEGEGALAAVRAALAANRVDLHLQPIVNLPQRRVCFYEGFTRLRDETDRIIMPAEFLGAAQSAGLLGAIDNLLLFRCVQIVRRLSERDRRIGVFCNIAASSLGDEEFFPQFLEFIRENRDLSGSLIFELSAQDFTSRTAVTARNMSKLADLGFRFSIDRASGLEMDLPALQTAGVRFMKIEGGRLLSQLADPRARPISAVSRDIAPQDVPAVFARYNIDLIADRVETEKTVVEVLEYDIPYGQGHVFGQPKPIRDGLLENGTATIENAASAALRKVG